MRSDIIERSTSEVLDGMKGVRDALTVRRVFGDPVELADVTVIPVAKLAGGGGGGGGGDGLDASVDADAADATSTGERTTDEQAASGGMGAGFGIGVQPLGVYEVRDGHVVWKPSVDVNRIARGGQVLAGIAVVCTTLVLLQRGRR